MRLQGVGRCGASLVVLLVLAVASPAVAEQAEEVVDRIVAVVDEDPILLSDVERVLSLGLVPRVPGESEAAARRRGLDRLIEEKLRFHEIDRFGFSEVPVQEVDEQLAQVRARLGSAARLAAELERVGMDETELRQLLARQIMVLTYVDERLGPRVFVSLEEIRSYYDGVLVPELAARGEKAPPLAEVREQIRAVLKDSRLNEEIERWTEVLRLEADVEDFLERQGAEPERVILSLDAEADG